jgi:hypothetical protein
MPGFEMTDIYPIFKGYFNEKAIKALENKTEHLVHQYNEKLPEWLRLLGKLNLKSCEYYKDIDADQLYVRKADLVHFAVARAGIEKLDVAINRVINSVNHVADMGFTRAALVPFSILKIYPPDRPEPDFLVISYVTLSQKGSTYVKNNMKNVFVEEGGITERIE